MGNYGFPYSSLVLLILFQIFLLDIACCMSVGKSSANDTEAETDTETDLISLSQITGLNPDSKIKNPVLDLLSSTQEQNTLKLNEFISPKSLPQEPLDLKVSISSPNRYQEKGLDFYYPNGAKNLRNFARTRNSHREGPLGTSFLGGLLGFAMKTMNEFGIFSPFRGMFNTLFGQKAPLMQKLWIVKELWQEEENNRKQMAFDRRSGDLRLRFLRSIIQKTFNHYKKKTAMMEMKVEDRKERLKKFVELPMVVSLLGKEENQLPPPRVDEQQQIDIDPIQSFSQTLMRFVGALPFFRNFI